MTRRLLVTGATGSLGRRVMARAAAAGFDAVGASPTASVRLDIRDLADVRRVVAEVRPDAIVHTAAGRDRDDWPATADGAAHVALAAAGIRLVHVSSDAIFSGRQGEYDEDALPDPVYAYGAAKAAAETAVRAVDPTAAIVRTSIIMGDGRGAHEILTHDLIAGRVAGALFTDEIRKPVHVDDLADALLELAAGDYAGVLNVAGADAISRYDLGVLVARRDGLDPAAIPAARIADVGLQRPADLRLVTDRAAKLLSVRLRGAREFVRAAPR
ncbi:dTDP-4-dehydrorhamnose reductase [Actinoplanes campanulatus]|uniref:dTDP-4-dehydrorhamnose reductase n=1 Tax=Actinoplanes campanulatus TaxID=113559 RepID=A0A7W5ALL7_9ACTN|nr:sugar nucleotide-binding protein [Actinoplanes campanulatus]MBB3098521.1 dTDP-4-dehydrorhamnose reductase [Actinoplanes campanulatus]GGN35692.1 dTDP-4-dehydrorhamnose reductase [Actinoplanes campanulatus]GID39215.1 dTDP-4-dehydrorhamnose reductase [Actinoplanes campanulatus]